MYQKFLKVLAGWCTGHYKKVLVMAVVITVIMGGLAATLDINLSFLAILPDDDEAKLFRKFTQQFGGSSDLLLVVEAEQPEQAKAFAEELSKRLKVLQQKLEKERTGDEPVGIRSVDYKIDLEFVENYGLLFTDTKMIEQARQILETNQKRLPGLYQDMHLLPYLEKSNLYLHNLALQMKIEKQKPTKAEVMQVLKMTNGTLEIVDQYLRRGKVEDDLVRRKAIESLGGDFEQYVSTYIEGGYMFSPDMTTMLISLRLNIDLINMPLGVTVFQDIQEVTQKTAEKYPGLQANYTGMMAMAHEDQSSTIQRFQWLSGISLILVVLLFFYISRLRQGPILIAVPMLMAMIWTFGLVKIGLGFVSLTSMVFAVLLFGLGIDFAIHIMVRINEVYRETNDFNQAIQIAIQSSGRGIITGGLTTAMAFFAMCVASDKAAVHLGYTTGWGLICCLVAMMTVFPALLYQALHKGDQQVSMDIAEQNKAITWWVSMVCKRPAIFLACCFFALVFFGYQLRYFHMEYDLEKIITRDMPSLTAKKKVQEKFGRTNDFLMVKPKDLEDDRKLTRELEKSGVFAEVLSVSKFIPPHEDQKQRLTHMKKIHQILQNIRIERKARDDSPISQLQLTRIFALLTQFQMETSVLIELEEDSQIFGELEKLEKQLRHMRKFIKTLDNNSLVRKNFGRLQYLLGEETSKLLTKFTKMSSPLDEQGKEKILTLQTLPGFLRDRFVSKDQSLLILVYPKSSSFDPANISRIKSELELIAPGRATGILMVSEKFVTAGTKDFPLILGTILTMLVLLLLWDFRDPRYIIFTGLPLLFSGVISMGIICMSGATISVLMLSAFPLVFGIGIDDGIHILHRYKIEKDVVKAVSQTGRAILLTTITTMVSFGVLLFTNHNGLIGMGLLVGIGITLCFVFSITVLPAVLTLFEKKSE